ncbi:MAG: hypothetical protein ACOY4K_06605 [Pseudomonadota bacterium]
MAAEPIAEPLPPGGFTEEDFAAALVATFGPELGGDIHRWLMAEWRPWAREGWARAQRGSEFCRTVNKPPD